MVSPKDKERDYNIIITENGTAAICRNDEMDKNNQNNTMYIRSFNKSLTTTKSDDKIQ